ncbi:MAG: aminotransferase class V-fold PLP-dependent enzyme, partial [Methanobacteriota archaeon]
MATREHRDVAEIRKDFPILDRRVHGKPLVYLDNAATSHRPTSVVEAMSRFFTHTNANVHRGIHQLSVEATAAYEGAHEKVAKFVHAKGGMREIVFTKNTTESVNLVAYAWGLEHLKPGVEVLSTEMEHHSNIVPWQILCEETGARLRYLTVTGTGE